jgi:hypothetical protein
MGLDLTEDDLIEGVVEKTAEATDSGESLDLARFERIIKGVHGIMSGLERMTYNVRQQQASNAQGAIKYPVGQRQIGTMPQQPQYPQEPSMPPEPESDVPELTAENFKDYFDNPDEVMAMITKVLEALPDEILLSQATKLLQQNFEMYGGMKAKEARKQFKTWKIAIKQHLKQYFPKQPKKKEPEAKEDWKTEGMEGSQQQKIEEKKKAEKKVKKSDRPKSAA